jgi:ATP-binding cassette, subfamily C, bacteriocin exporter
VNTRKTLMKLVGQHRSLIPYCCGLIMFVSSLAIVVPLYTQFVIEYVVPARDTRLIFYAALSFGGFLLVKFLFTVLQDVAVAIFRQKMERSYIESYFASAFNLKLNEFNRYKIGAIISRFGVFFNDIEWFLCDFIFFVFYALFVFVFLSIVMVAINPIIFAVVLACLPLHVINFRLHAARLRAESSAYLAEQARLSSFVLHTIDGRDEIKSYFLNPLFNQRLGRIVDTMHAALGAKQLYFYRQDGVQASLVMLNHIAVIVAGSYQIINGTSSLGALFFFLLLLQFFYSPIYRFSSVNQSLQAACVKIDEMQRLIANPEQENIASTIQHIPEFDELRIAGLRCGTLLRDAEYSFRKGRIYMLTGASGAGKTTLLNLLTRFVAKDSGRICLDQLDTDQLSDFDLRRVIGYALQEKILFNASIVENIHLDPATPPDLPRVERACYLAAADEFINALPQRLWSEVHENGANFSGGQQQRLGLARIFYYDPPVMLLDEPSSALDPLTERIFFERLQSIKHNKIIIVVSHRADTQQYADELIRLADGKLHCVVTPEPALTLDA